MDYSDTTRITRVFGEEPCESWRFYSASGMKGATKHWHEEGNPDWFGRGLDGIVPKASVLIGDLGVDRIFALDYRTSEPSVRFMTIDARWICVAASVSEFLSRLGLEL